MRAASAGCVASSAGSSASDLDSAGKQADIIAVKGDVLKYISLLQRVDFVMKKGKVYKHNKS